MSGRITIPEACDILGIQESMFHKMRSQVLQTALGRLEPRPLGRPSQLPSLHDGELTRLEAENVKLQIELKAADVRRELAENLPRLGKPATDRCAVPAGKKTTQSTTKRRRKRLKKSRR
jgi:hypothetical protein